MVRNLYFLLLIVLLVFFGCQSSNKLLREGKYDEAVQIAVKKLMRNPENEKQAQVLAKAYPLAVSKIEERINFLKKEGNPANWDEIYRLYSKLKRMQEQVEIVTPVSVGNKIVKFQHKDYDNALLQAKSRAAEYHYAMAKKLMKENNKFAFRKAYQHLLQVKQYDPTYPDLDRLMQQCLANGTTYVLLVPVNKTIYRLPKEFMYDLINLPVDRLNSQWVVYHTNDVRNGNYDLIVYVVLKDAKISANEQKEENFTQTKKIVVGYQTVRDSSGQTHKVPQYRQVSCNVKRVVQRKIAHIYGELQYFDNHSRQNVKTVPVAADHVFENSFAIWSGDKRACSKQVLDESHNRIVAFPADLDMIIAAQKTLKNVIWQALSDNRYWVERRF